MKAALLIIFVCEFGSAKSVVAAAELNRIAAAKGLPFRAISRAVNPDRQAVKPPVRAGMEKDGLPIPTELPQRLAREDVARARWVVSFGPLPEGVKRGEEWADIPPITERYDDSRSAIRERVRALLDRLANE